MSGLKSLHLVMVLGQMILFISLLDESGLKYLFDRVKREQCMLLGMGLQRTTKLIMLLIMLSSCTVDWCQRTLTKYKL